MVLLQVGWSYENQALEFLGGYSFLGVEALGARLSRTGHTIIVSKPTDDTHTHPAS